MKKYILYARTATEMVDNPNNSIKHQIDTLTDYAKTNNLNIGNVITEIGSGLTNKYSLRNLMITMLSGDFKGILCTSVDRLSRNYQAFMEFYKFTIDNGVEIITPNGAISPSLGSDTSSMFHIVFAQSYRDMISERIKRGIKMSKLRKSKKAVDNQE